MSRAIRDEYAGKIDEILAHTGQHYDENMTMVFFDGLEIPEPRYNLEISGGVHGAMTGRMLEAVEKVLQRECPGWFLVYGDTISPLAGALAAAKLYNPGTHVEAGVHSFNMCMPEEVNRILADRVSSLLFCPTTTAVDNLSAEGTTRGVYNVGDVMYDVALFYRERARQYSTIPQRLGLEPGCFALVNCHRAENTDDPRRLESILAALAEIARHVPVNLLLHPWTHKLARDYGLSHLMSGLTVIEPLPFLDMVALQQAAKVILTDSGRVQKEAFPIACRASPCVTRPSGSRRSGWAGIVWRAQARKRFWRPTRACWRR